MRHVLLMTVLALVTACSRQQSPAPSAESQSDNAAASAPNGVGSQRDGDERPGTAQNTSNATAPPSATARRAGAKHRSERYEPLQRRSARPHRQSAGLTRQSATALSSQPSYQFKPHERP
jgi:hypothetical protein